jgi:hypothetical protein
MRSGAYRFGDIGLYGTDPVAETLKRFREQSADNCVVFYDQSAQRLHRITFPPAPRSFTQTATTSKNLDLTA